MEEVRKNIAETRAHTDASLDAERASTDSATELKAARAQRILDDLIERDRILAEEGLRNFRENADSVLVRDRSASLEPSIAMERQRADEGKRVERKITDAVLDRAHQRATAVLEVLETERLENESEHRVLEARRQDTDDQLSSERSGTDAAVEALDETKSILADAQSERTRQRDVLGMVTHDLRSPLSVIAMNAQSIADVTKDAIMREDALEVTRAAARMGRLLMDLLDVARIESRSLHMAPERNDVGRLLADVLQSYRPLFATRAVTFTAEVPAPAIFASFDRDRIVQVLSNLIGNAMKFTPPGGTVALRVERRGSEVEFALSDSGLGIHPDALAHVFERFWQIDSETRRGLGLGLYICKNIVEGHGGRIWGESEPGRGATFRFTLPAS
jgi:signal transduction histidine kinase